MLVKCDELRRFLFKANMSAWADNFWKILEVDKNLEKVIENSRAQKKLKNNFIKILFP